MLADWLRYQRDIGVDALIFDSASAIRELLAPPQRRQRPDGGRDRGADDRRGGGSAGAVAGLRRVGATKPSAAGSGPGFSKMKPLDELDPMMLERRRPAASARGNSGRRDRLAGLYRLTMECTKCPMASSRAKVVFGTGSADGRLFVLGDAPSAADDGAGLPFFQGDVSRMFDNILGKMRLDRKNDIFASYLQKCGGADAEFIRGCADMCRSILDKQVEIIEPKALLVFGEQAANVLLGDDAGGIERMRMVNHSYRKVPVVVTYGLPLMLKDASLRHGAWNDIERVLNIIRG